MGFGFSAKYIYGDTNVVMSRYVTAGYVTGTFGGAVALAKKCGKPKGQCGDDDMGDDINLFDLHYPRTDL